MNLKKTTIAFSAALILFSAFAFIRWQINPQLWPEAVRFTYVVIAGLILGWVKIRSEI